MTILATGFDAPNMTAISLKTAGAQTIANGYRIVPIEPGTKRPILKDWPSTNATPATLEQWEKADMSEWGVGILGEETPGVDLDISDGAVLENVLDWCREHIGVENTRVGRAPRALFVCRADKPFPKMRSRKFTAPDGTQHQVEILGKGSQFVAYAVHPDTGKPYEWSGADPLHTPSDLLPTITPEQGRELIAYFESTVPSTWVAQSSTSSDDLGDRKGNPEKQAHLPAIRSAVAAIPNDENTDYDAWIKVCYSLWSAVGEDKEVGWEIFDEWSSKNELYDPENTERVWNAEKKVKDLGAGTLFFLAEQRGWVRPRIDAVDEFGLLDIDVGEPPAAPAVRVVQLNAAFQPFRLQDPKSLPPREWLYDRHYIRGFVSTTVAPGGLGKSSEKIVEALAMVTGRPLLGARPPERLRVAYWGGEDPRDETSRRFTAACMHYQISSGELGESLVIADGETLPIKLARESHDGIQVAKPLVEALTRYLRDLSIDVLVIDPFVSSHAVSENDNSSINTVVSLWREIARGANCSVELVHHAVKVARLPGQSDNHGIAQARGGGALIDAVRSGRYLVSMTPEEARKAGILEPRGYYRVESGKANMAPAEAARWRRLISVSLGNGSALYPDGDHVGVVTRWDWPVATDGLEADVLPQVKGKVAAGTWRANSQAADWVGYAIAEALDIDPGPPKRTDRNGTQEAARAKCKQLQAAWTASGDLVQVEDRDSRNGRSTPFIRAVFGASAPSAP